ncbi:hypothetical protein MAPG_02035 [Magnaporthiopsis poae ATCC 64411]|uniref:Uncharacterized protein n=1 Tax=Magnaporthiopsis poae (strain ATCC 64411 / 73-15) TaxID=644358 RepID=A0A0C4DQ97_MAGP6|nr:hypothetical protein MAPG_02035 [Magnaporthiopsis poae ATCC 64411]
MVFGVIGCPLLCFSPPIFLLSLHFTRPKPGNFPCLFASQPACQPARPLSAYLPLPIKQVDHHPGRPPLPSLPAFKPSRLGRLVLVPKAGSGTPLDAPSRRKMHYHLSIPFCGNQATNHPASRLSRVTLGIYSPRKPPRTHQPLHYRNVQIDLQPFGRGSASRSAFLRRGYADGLPQTPRTGLVHALGRSESILSRAPPKLLRMCVRKTRAICQYWSRIPANDASPQGSRLPCKKGARDVMEITQTVALFCLYGSCSFRFLGGGQGIWLNIARAFF